eukprot:s4128_g6.t1
MLQSSLAGLLPAPRPMLQQVPGVRPGGPYGSGQLPAMPQMNPLSGSYAQLQPQPGQPASPTNVVRPGQGSFQLQRPVGSLGAMDGAPQVMMQPGQGMRTVPANASMGHGPSREQALQQRVAELEEALRGKDQEIKELQTALSRAGIKLPSSFAKKAKAREKVGSGGFRKVSQSQPAVPYEAIDQEDPIDLRLEEFYNGTGSAIPFQRINRGFYRFGETILELNIINHKLMARTEDGWNRSKFGPIEKFLMYYENIEREKAGILLEP